MRRLKTIFFFKSHRLLFIVILAIIFSVIGIVHAATSRYDGMYEHLKDLNLIQLKDKGNAFIAEHKPDSALACYMMITSRYSDKMDTEDKKLVCNAYNNAGYVYSLVYSDYSLAYQFLLKSMKLAKEIEYTKIYPYIYLNLGNIYLYYDDYNNTLAYYQKAYETGKQEEAWDVVVTTFSNVALGIPRGFDEENIEVMIRDFRDIDVPDGEMVEYTKILCDMANYYIDGDMDKAMECLKKARDSVDVQYLPERHHNSLDYCESMLLRKQGRLKESLALLNDRTSGSTDGDRIGIYQDIAETHRMLGNKDSADLYRMKMIDTRDSVLRNQNYALIRDMHSSFELQEFERNIREVEIRSENNARIAVILLVNVILLTVFIVLLVRKNRRLNEALTDLYRKVRPGMIDDAENAETIVPAIASENISHGESTTDPDSGDDRQRFQLDPETCRDIKDKIISVMEDTAVISQREFTIKKLSEIIDTRERYVSYVLNECMHRNFNALLNEYRIAKARCILADSEEMKNLTIEGVAMSLGFKSRSNFANIFKKLTGLTPSEYRDIAKEESDR